jgi:hypothetical protein
MDLDLYILTKLSAVSTVLGWDAENAQIILIVEEAEALADGDADAERPIALMLAWGQAVNELAAKYDFTADKATYHEQQLFENAVSMYAAARAAAQEFLPASAVVAHAPVTDPYTEEADAEFE